MRGLRAIELGRSSRRRRAWISSAQPRRIEALFAALKRRRDNYLARQTAATFPGEASLQVDPDVAAIVVKSVFQTTASAGYPNISFVVDQDSGIRKIP